MLAVHGAPSPSKTGRAVRSRTRVRGEATEALKLKAFHLVSEIRVEFCDLL